MKNYFPFVRRPNLARQARLCVRARIHSFDETLGARRRRRARGDIARAARRKWRDASTRAMGIIFTFDHAGQAPRWTRGVGTPDDARAWNGLDEAETD